MKKKMKMVKGDEAMAGEESEEAQEDTTAVARHGDAVERVESKIS
jgi:hypothetical protein